MSKKASIEKGDGEEICEINIVPLADISLVLLIILMLITPMVMQSMIQVAASRGAVAAATEETKRDKPLFLEVRIDGCYLNTQRMKGRDELLDKLRGELSRNDDKTVILTGGKGITHEDMVIALDTAKQAGALKLSLVKKGPAGMKRVRDHGNSISGVNITPIIDITLVLLIIMLVAAPVMNIPNMDVALPEAYTSESKEKNISVSLGTDRRLAVDEAIVPMEEFPKRLNEALKKKGDTLVIIRADKSVYYEDVENLMELIKTRTKAKRIAVATKQKMVQAAAP